jgi:hypothetical protein
MAIRAQHFQRGYIVGYDRKYLLWALAYVVAGMLLGVVMGASQDHSQHVTHAHILLVGFVTSLAYAVIHKLWLVQPSPRLARLQFLAHQSGALVMFAGLLMLFGHVLPIQQLDPVLALASIIVLLAAVLMMVLVARSRPANP